jgi:hypothetical protein
VRTTARPNLSSAFSYTASSGRTEAMRSARRCCSTVKVMSARVTKKIIVAMMFICGGMATRAAPEARHHPQRGGLATPARTEQLE